IFIHLCFNSISMRISIWVCAATSLASRRETNKGFHGSEACGGGHQHCLPEQRGPVEQ
ncbi:uncharacterized, partial [Tachysurus ichikawai]